MVSTNRQRELLRHWESELSKYEKELSVTKDPFDIEHFQHMCHYASHKILQLERDLYPTP